MSDLVNYLQRVGHSRCIRCDFETSDAMSFAEQDVALRKHLDQKHPGWLTDGAAGKPALSLEQKIKEAAAKCRGQKWLPEGVDGLSTENGEPVVFDGGYDTSGFCQDEQREFCIAASPANILALLAEKDAERDEWKRIADRYRMNSHHSCAVWHPGPCDNRCGICKAYDVLAGKGE